MFSGGQIGWEIRSLFQRDCQNAEVPDVAACVETLTQKYEEQIDPICMQQISRGRKRVSQVHPDCLRFFRNTLWMDLEDLKEKLAGNLSRFVDKVPTTLHNLFDFSKEAAKALKPLPPKEEQQSPPANERPKNIVWEQPLAVVLPSLTHEKEWFDVTTKIAFSKEGGLYSAEIQWRYWLVQNGDETLTLYWRNDKNDKAPDEKDKRVPFKLSEGQLPKTLLLIVDDNKQVHLYSGSNV